MATIKRLEKKTNPSEKRKLRQRLYQDTQYRKIRDWYMQTHPLCEVCLKEHNRIVQSVHLHHKNSPFKDGLDDDQRLYILRDETNFEALCEDCHENRHGNVSKMIIFGKNP